MDACISTIAYDACMAARCSGDRLATPRLQSGLNPASLSHSGAEQKQAWARKQKQTSRREMQVLMLTKYASKVYIVHRRAQFTASKIMQRRVLDDPKVQASTLLLLLFSQVTAAHPWIWNWQIVRLWLHARRLTAPKSGSHESLSL